MGKNNSFGKYFPLLMIFSMVISACDPSGDSSENQETVWNKDQPNNVILYKTNSGAALYLNPRIYAWAENHEVARVVSNTYSEDGICKIVFDNDLVSIDVGAFKGCYSLVSISFPPSLRGISCDAFQGCSSLTSISFPPSLRGIGESAFFDCSCLTSISLPSSITSLDYQAFGYCRSLTAVTILAPNPPNDSGDAFKGSPCTIYVPSASVSAYKTAWPEYADRILPIP